MTEVIRDTMKPGDKYRENDLLRLMADFVGIDADEIRSVLPELAMRCILVNTVDDTWKVPSPEYEMDEDLEPAEPEESKQLSRTDLVGGLPEGPYSTKGEIVYEMCNYKEFLLEDGREPIETSLYGVINRFAKKGGLVEMDGQFHIEVNPKIKLTRLEKPFRLKTAHGTYRRTKEEQEQTKVKPKPKSPEPAPSKPFALDLTSTQYLPTKEVPPMEKGFKAIRQQLGKIPRPAIMPGVMTRLRKLFPKAHWDQAARLALDRRVKKAGVSSNNLVRDRFTDEEWDALAWEMLKGLPLEAVAPHINQVYENRVLVCEQCIQNGKSLKEAEFVFTSMDQEFFFEKFGEVTPPRNCHACRKERKEVKR
jgi:hypothetical protein